MDRPHHVSDPGSRRPPSPFLLAAATGFALGVLVSLAVWTLNDLALCHGSPTLILPIR